MYVQKTKKIEREAQTFLSTYVSDSSSSSLRVLVFVVIIFVALVLDTDIAIFATESTPQYSIFELFLVSSFDIIHAIIFFLSLSKLHRHLLSFSQFFILYIPHVASFLSILFNIIERSSLALSNIKDFYQK